MKIGKINLGKEPALALAPMAGYTNIAFRQLEAELGADIVYTELVSAAAIVRAGKNNANTERLMQIGSAGITGIQVFGSNENEIAQAAKIIGKLAENGECDAKFIDINFGCTAKKIVRQGAGSALLKSGEKMAGIIEAAAKASPLPITAKIRIGSEKNENIEIAKMLKKAGISALAVHARTAKQKFSGKADWGAIKEIADALQIPVIGNGDVKSPEDVLRMHSQAKCAGVMIGRASLSDPFIFLHAKKLMEEKEFEKTGWEEKIDFLSKHIALCEKYGIGFISSKELAIKLAAGFRGAGRMREKIAKSKNENELMGAMKSG